MTEQMNAETQPNSELPAFVKAAPELLPVWDWWVKEGRSTLMTLAVAGLAVAGFYGVRNWLHARDAKANAALVSAFNTDELESAVNDYGSTKVGPALRLRLAKSYYDAGSYESALDLYRKLAKEKGNEAFADVALVGQAYALEGLEKFKEAGEAFAAFAQDAAKTNSYLLLTAKLGAIRCKALLGDKDGAAKDFDALKAAETDELAKTRIERMADVVKRHDPSRAARSLFDAANAAADAVAAEKKAEAKPADVKPADAKPAEVKPAEAKPAEKKEEKPAEKK